MVNTRHVGLDMLRVLLAFMVIGIHIIAPATGAVGMCVEWMPTKFLIYGMEAFCYPAVNTYVILSGFFSFAHNKSLYQAVRSLGKLWVCLIFFSILGVVIGAIYNHQAPSLSTILARLFPVCSGEWWYMTNYFVLILISPILNKLICSYSRKSHLYVICGALIICSVIPFFLKYEDKIGLNLGYGLIWFVVLYCTGAYLYRIKDDIIEKIKPQKYFWGGVGLMFLFVMVNNVLSKFDITKGFGFGAYNSVFVYAEAVLLFCYFYTVKVRSSKFAPVISWIASGSLASYIFHCQADVGPMLWELTNPSKYANSLMIVPISVAIILGVFSIATLIESVRRWLLNFIPVDRWVDNIIATILQK